MDKDNSTCIRHIEYGGSLWRVDEFKHGKDGSRFVCSDAFSKNPIYNSRTEPTDEELKRVITRHLARYRKGV